MLFGAILTLHVIVCMLLSLIILMQAGRGGGLTENFSAAESMFGAKTNIVLVKATTILASIFIVTCLSLAFFSSQKNKSLIQQSLADNKKPASAASASAQKSTNNLGNTPADSASAAGQTPVKPDEPVGPQAKEGKENAKTSDVPQTPQNP